MTRCRKKTFEEIHVDKEQKNMIGINAQNLSPKD